MIKSIHFKNYKIFKDRQTLELKPITVIIGKNNSGKSAVAKLPTIIEESFKSGENEAINFINKGIEAGGELRDLVYGRANRLLEIEIDYYDKQRGCDSKLSLGIIITEERKKQVSKIDFWKLDKEADFHYSGNGVLYHDEISDNDYFCEFLGFRLVNCFFADKPDSSADIPSLTAKLKTDYIGPIRTIPERDYRLTSMKLNGYGILGENAYQFLIEDSLTTEKSLLNKVSDWYVKNFEGWGVRVNQDKSPIFQIEIEKGNLRQNIKDTGIGMSQVLPIITRALMPCEEDTLIIIEEPETHLHPAAHGSLAKLFVESIKQGKKRYLIETHSQNFILRLRRLVAEKQISHKELAIYYVDFKEDENYSVLERIDIDEFGRVSKWPEGIFSETLDETIGIRNAQLENSAYGN